MKPYSESCDQNREPILAVIEPLLINFESILEVGTGTGQHAVYFAEKMPHLIWHTSDRKESHAGIKQWLDDAGLANTREPLELDTSVSEWPSITVDAVFSANTAHIMHWRDVEGFVAGVGELLTDGGLFLLYGPFNYNGRYTSDSNKSFDAWLKARDVESGIRGFEDLNRLAEIAGMQLKEDFPMPANNRLLCWRK